jgi:asparagine synthase (glutamine-hydrolysing)
MCGICGIWGTPDQAATAAMTAAMRHRGPDDSGCFTEGPVSLGMTRLAVIDASPAGHQPMSNPDRTVWIVYNGEVYNFQEQRSRLEALGHTFVSASDTEVVLRLYEQYGDDFLLRLRGMFALAIYDKRRGPGKERLLLARDPLGIKPLLYARRNGRILFASEMKALLASGWVEREIDPESLRLLLTFGSVYQPRTMVKGVDMLLPAHRMIVENGRPRLERYWSMGIDRRAELRTLPYPDQVRLLSAALEESVRLQMVSDVPLGAFLSGGVDSSILVAIMARKAGSRIKTFSVGFESEGAAIDESGVARTTAAFLGTDHTHVLVRGAEVARRIVHIASALDQPSVDGVNSYFISWAARQALTVAVSGTGGDELFAGYPWFVHMAADQRRRRPLGARTASALAGLPVFDGMLATMWGQQIARARGLAGFLNRYSRQYQIYGSAGAAAMLAPDLRARARAGRSEAKDLSSVDELAAGSVLERVSGLCLRGYTSNQLLRDIDATSMAHSLEVRVPYLDVPLIDLALSLPDGSKLRPNSAPDGASATYRSTGAKRILIDAGKSLLPKDFDVQPKRGFAMPFDHWLLGPVRDVFRETLSEEVVRRRGWFDGRQVQKTKRDFLERRIGWPQPWLLMMTELWAGQVLDSSGGKTT